MAALQASLQDSKEWIGACVVEFSTGCVQSVWAGLLSRHDQKIILLLEAHHLQEFDGPAHAAHTILKCCIAEPDLAVFFLLWVLYIAQCCVNRLQVM